MKCFIFLYAWFIHELGIRMYVRQRAHEIQIHQSKTFNFIHRSIPI